MKKISFGVAVCAALLCLGGAANAVQYTWNFNVNKSAGHTVTFDSTDGSHTLTVSAFYASSKTSAFQDAIVRPSIQGLGVESPGDDSTDKQYLDNLNGWDILVFDSGIDNFNWDAVILGSIYSGADSKPELTYWVGGNGGVTDATFNTMCLTGSNCALTTNNLFSAPTTLSNLSSGSSVTLPTAANGRYLVVSGALDSASGSGGYDKFKIKTVPAPQTLALFGLGALAMAGLARRKVLVV